jgi:hypothetical protein
MVVVSLNMDWKAKSTEAAVLDISRVKSDKEYETGAQGSSVRTSSTVGAAMIAVGRRRAVTVVNFIFNDVVCGWEVGDGLRDVMRSLNDSDEVKVNLEKSVFYTTTWLYIAPATVAVSQCRCS